MYLKAIITCATSELLFDTRTVILLCKYRVPGFTGALIFQESHPS